MGFGFHEAYNKLRNPPFCHPTFKFALFITLFQHVPDAFYPHASATSVVMNSH